MVALGQRQSARERPANKVVYEAHLYFNHDGAGQYRGTYDEEGRIPTSVSITSSRFSTGCPRITCRDFLASSAFRTTIPPPESRAMRLFSTGQTWRLAVTDASAIGSPFWLVHRGDLHQVLAKALEQRAPGSIHVGVRCVGFAQDADGVSLLHDNGGRTQGDALIGADGVHSTIGANCSAKTARPSRGSWHGVRLYQSSACQPGSDSRSLWPGWDRPARSSPILCDKIRC